jgi:alpha-1,6-mannosyltransferase
MTARFRSRAFVVVALGVGSLAPYLYAWHLQDLRRHTMAFELAFFVAFTIYAAATVWALRTADLDRKALALAFVFAAAMQALLVDTPPTLSDDMYRYVWDGRVQAQGISPYRYPPDAAELEGLRDREVWPFINRKQAVTVYPAGAELAFALLWRIRPDSIRFTQTAMALGGLVAGALLLGLLEALKRSTARVLIFLWSPLLAFETAHSAHVDGLVLPLLVGMWWARVRDRDVLVGFLLGLATAIKIYPAILLPALWRPRHSRGRWQMPLAFALTVAACYTPYVAVSGSGVLGYLPKYFRERFNMGLAGELIPRLIQRGIDPNLGMFVLLAGALSILAVWMVLRPARDAEEALRRCVWLIGAFTLLTQNLFSWYMLWLLPLVALFLRPGRLVGLQADAWTGWWLFCGLVALSYTFFVSWRPVRWALWAQFILLAAFLIYDAARLLKPLVTQRLFTDERVLLRE